MEIVRKITDLKKRIRQWKKSGYIIGFVPTMGALHEGHLSLIRQARQETGKVVVSIFVNPIQFGHKEDLTKYPRPFRQDIKLCESVGVNLIFYPSVKEMYPDDSKTYIDMKDLPDVLCGHSRPGHFRGVMTVVNKLFNLVEPDIAYFGQKDYQQVLIIK
jgi:pantoate--beta-alanine ligase